MNMNEWNLKNDLNEHVNMRAKLNGIYPYSDLDNGEREDNR